MSDRPKPSTIEELRADLTNAETWHAHGRTQQEREDARSLIAALDRQIDAMDERPGPEPHFWRGIALGMLIVYGLGALAVWVFWF
jgi:hypothetical protein